MASGNTVELKFAGDARSLNRTFEEIGGSSRRMADEVGESSRGLVGGVSRLTDAADENERKFRGLGDTITGTSDIMANFQSGNVVGLAMGFADLAGGIADFAGPVLSGLLQKLGLVTVATEGETVAQTGLNTAMSLNPIGIVVIALAALVAGFIIAYQKSETFRNAVNAGLGEMRDLAVGVWNWVSDHWPLLLGILTGPFGLAVVEIIKHRDDIVRTFTELPGKLLGLGTDILNAGKDLGSRLFNGFVDGVSGVGAAIGHEVEAGIKSVVNTLIDKVNSFQIHVHIDPLGRFGPSVDFDWNGLGIPRLHAGGIVPGVVGTEVPAILQAGERVSAAGSSGAGAMTVNVYALDPRSAATAVVRAIDEYEQANGRRYARAS